MTDQPAAECSPPCIACMTDESHDPTPPRRPYRGAAAMTDPTSTPPLTPRQEAAACPLETPAGVDADMDSSEGAAGAQAGAQRLARMAADTVTDDALDALYARLDRAEAAWARWRDYAQRCSDRSAADFADMQEQRDRARRIAVELENELAAVAGLHYAVSAVDHGSACDACDLAWPCATARALNPQEGQ